MTNETNNPHHSQWAPTAGGVLSIVAGSLGLLGSIFWLFFGNLIASNITNGNGLLIILIIASFSFFVIDIVAILGGVFAIQKRHWRWALAGGICAIIASRIMGVIALVFIAISRKDFE
jgi:hypothetical protein